MRRQFFSVADPLNDDLVAGVGQPVQGGVPEDGVVKKTEPLLHSPVAGDDEAGCPVTADDQLVEVGGLLGREAVETQVIQDQEIRGEKGTECPFHRVVHPGLGHGPEEIVGLEEANGMTGPEAQFHAPVSPAVVLVAKDDRLRPPEWLDIPE